MSLLKNFDKTCRVHQLVFEVRKSAPLRQRWKNEFDELATEYGLSEEEKRAGILLFDLVILPQHRSQL